MLHLDQPDQSICQVLHSDTEKQQIPIPVPNPNQSTKIDRNLFRNPNLWRSDSYQFQKYSQTYRKFCYLVQRFLLSFYFMEIIISDIPVEGLHLEGELPGSIFDLAPTDSIRPGGKIQYQVDIYSFDEAIVFSGKLNGPFELQCGVCLEFFDYEAAFPKWNSELDLEERQRIFDLEEVIREDFLLQLPSAPRCDIEGHREKCPKASIYSDDVQEPLIDERPPADDIWGALDDLK